MENEDFIEQKKKFKSSVLNAINNQDEKEFFELIGSLTYNEQFKYSSFAKENSSIYQKLMTNLIENIDSLAKNNKTNLKNICLYEPENELLAEALCEKTKNKDDLIELYMQKALRLSLNFSWNNYADKESLINNLYDLLEKYKSNEEFINPVNYFNHYFELNVFLTDDRINKNIKKLKKLDQDAFLPTPENIVHYLVSYENKEYLSYYLEKNTKNLTVSQKDYQYLVDNQLNTHNINNNVLSIGKKLK